MCHLPPEEWEKGGCVLFGLFHPDDLVDLHLVQDLGGPTGPDDLHRADRVLGPETEVEAPVAGRHEAPTRVIDGQVKLDLIVDRSSIEVFIQDGEAVISDRIFPSSQEPVIEVFAGDPSATVTEVRVQRQKSIWRD